MDAVSSNREAATYQVYFTDENGKRISDVQKIIFRLFDKLLWEALRLAASSVTDIFNQYVIKIFLQF